MRDHIQESLAEIYKKSPDKALKIMMMDNIKDAERIFELSKKNNYMDSQEFLDWQDRLNEISVMYK